MTPTQDNILRDHQILSQAETIGEAILAKWTRDNKTDIVVESISGLSLREWTSDNVSWIRYELTIRTKKEICSTNYADQFNP